MRWGGMRWEEWKVPGFARGAEQECSGYVFGVSHDVQWGVPGLKLRLRGGVTLRVVIEGV